MARDRFDSNEDAKALARAPVFAGSSGLTSWIKVGSVQGITATVLLLAIAGLLRYWPYWQLQTTLGELRAAGYPVTLEELRAWYPTPSGANAADVYLRAFDAFASDRTIESQLRGLSNVTSPLGLWDQELTPQIAEAIDTYLSDNAEAIRLLYEAASIEACRFPVDFTSSDASPHLEQLRRAAILLQMQVVLQIHQKQTQEALETVAVMLRLGDALKNEPTMSAQLSRHTLDTRACRALEGILASGALQDQWLAEMSSVLARKDYWNDMVRGIAGDQCLVLADVLLHFDNADDNMIRAVGARTVVKLGYLPASLRLIEVTKRMHEPGFDWQAETDRVSPGILGFTLGLDRVVEATAFSNEQINVARVGVAVRRYQLSVGKLPQQPEDLVPAYLGAIPLSLFDGKPLRLRATEAGLTVCGPPLPLPPGASVDGAAQVDREHLRRTRSATFSIDRSSVSPRVEEETP